MNNDAYGRYAPFIREYIYKKKWTDLRQVQAEACEAILDTDRHVIIASGTASGKTEAAFFPILTLLQADPPESVGVIYIGPLKALINDQFERLNSLLEDSGIPVWPWHGDVSQSVKDRALKTARGILQITPESLEALIMGKPEQAKRLFSDLRFIVIDEIHALMGADRGLQVLCLMSRLEKLAGCSPRRIGLSATLNDYGPAMDFLSAGSSREAQAVGIQGSKRTVSLCAENFTIPEDEKKAAEAKQEYNDFIYKNSHDKKCLIFTNSRGKAEEIIADMKSIAAKRGEPDVFLVHHGSISAQLRRETEHALRDSSGPIAAAATLTLELGIDIGDLDSTIQAGAPCSCSSFVQRLGRSGRRTGKSQMMFLSTQEQPEKDNGDPFAPLPWDLLRTIAVIQLYLEERWVEPFRQKKKPFSLLVHQTLSTLMSCGELPPAQLAERVLTLPPFRETVSQDEYRELLRFMLQERYIERMEAGGLIVGLEGEKYTNHYSFFAVFPDEDSYRVVSGDGEIGILTSCPEQGTVFVLGGRAWRADRVDKSQKIIYVSPGRNASALSWTGSTGYVHARIVRRMRQVLEEDTVYPYLQPRARQALEDARKYAAKKKLLKKPVVSGRDGSFYLCPWTGTLELQTIEKLLSCGLKEYLGISSVSASMYYLHITSTLGRRLCVRRMGKAEPDFDDPCMVLPEDETPRVDKYDVMVPEGLLRSAYLYNMADVPAAVEILAAVGGKAENEEDDSPQDEGAPATGGDAGFPRGGDGAGTSGAC